MEAVRLVALLFTLVSLSLSANAESISFDVVFNQGFSFSLGDLDIYEKELRKKQRQASEASPEAIDCSLVFSSPPPGSSCLVTPTLLKVYASNFVSIQNYAGPNAVLEFRRFTSDNVEMIVNGTLSGPVVFSLQQNQDPAGQNCFLMGSFDLDAVFDPSLLGTVFTYEVVLSFDYTEL